MSNLQIELKEGRMHDRHTVYYKCFCSENILRNNIESFIEKSSTLLKRNFNKNYHLNFIEIKNLNVGYGHIYFSDSAFYYMLTERTPDGKQNGKIILNPNYVSSEERKIITNQRINLYNEKKDILRFLWSWVYEYDYDDEDEELNGNTKYIFVKESFLDLGTYLVDNYAFKSAKACLEYKKAKNESSDSSLEILENIKLNDTLKIEISTISFKFDNYIDTISITGFPLWLSNDQILNQYSKFFEEDIKNYIKKVVNKQYLNSNFIEVSFKLKQYAQLINAICRSLECEVDGQRFVLKNKPVNSYR